MTLSFGFSVSAAEPDGVPISVDTETTELSESVSPRFPGLAGIKEVKIYPADSQKNVYYKDSYEYWKSSYDRQQWLNGTLSPKTAALFNEKGCDSFYIVVTVFSHSASIYELYDYNTKIKRGACVANFNNVFDFMITKSDTTMWKVMLYELSSTQGLPLWGSIKFPE